jgi:hypothetical protein
MISLGSVTLLGTSITLENMTVLMNMPSKSKRSRGAGIKHTTCSSRHHI